MSTIRDVLHALERIAPAKYAFHFDKVGLQVGDESGSVTRAVVSLDRSLGSVDFCTEVGAQMLIAHHPLIFRPLESVTSRTHTGRTILRLARSNIAFAAAHTNWDAARGGVNDRLCEVLGLDQPREFGTAAGVDQLKLVFFCPPESVNELIDACSEAGAGHIGLYRRCAFLHTGTGTFFGEEGSDPVVGSPGKIQTAEEMRIEMVLPSDRERFVAKALSRIHPYEEPAFDFFKLAEKEEQPCGRIGILAQPMALKEFAEWVATRLATKTLAWGDPTAEIARVAVVGGSADEEWKAAQSAGADVLVTGEVRQHNALEASESGFAIVSAGHYATEQPGAIALKQRLEREITEIEWFLYTPDEGLAGRPF